MTTPQMKTPVSTSIVPNYPNPQTALGALDDGITYKNDFIQLGGQQPSPSFWNMRNEYCNQLTWTNQDPVATTLGNIDVLRYCGDNMNDPEPMNSLTLAYNPNNAYASIIWPRFYNWFGTTFSTFSIKYDFWIHKPVGPVVGGKLRIAYNPGLRKDYADTKLLAGTMDLQDTLFRENMWEWDIKASDTFSVELKGNIPLKFMNNSLPLGDDFSIIGTDLRVFFPFFQSTYGTLSITVLNPYTNGSIFSDTVNISVFKSVCNGSNYIMRGHRHDLNLMTI